jgi:hypothetical protein
MKLGLQKRVERIYLTRLSRDKIVPFGSTQLLYSSATRAVVHVR